MPCPFGSEPRGDSAFGAGFGEAFGAGFGEARDAAGFVPTDEESFSSFASRPAIFASRSFLVVLFAVVDRLVAIAGAAI